jgi:putative ABC transport system substrate-binding protein
MAINIGRREFISALGGTVVAWPITARAQQPERMRRIGVLMALAADDPEGQARLVALVQGLQESGWTDGRNVRIDTRWAAGDADRFRRYAAELIALAPDVILASGGTGVGALLQATRTVPIVFTQTNDPVGAGYVDSLARPGGNATGFTNMEYGMSGKYLELLKEIAPRMARAAVLRDPTIPQGIGQFGAIQAVAPSFGVELRPIDVRDAPEIERAVTAFARAPNSGLIVTGSALTAGSSHSDHHAGGPAQIARGLLGPLLRHRRRPDLLRARFDRPTPARGRLCRSHPQGREAGRPSGASTDQVRVGDQSEDRQGARSHRAADATRAHRCGDRVTDRAFISRDSCTLDVLRCTEVS